MGNRIGHVRLDALDPPTLDALYADLEADRLGPVDGAVAHTQVHRAPVDAVRWDLLALNPADLVDPPKPVRASSRRGRLPSSARSWRVLLGIGCRPVSARRVLRHAHR